MKCSFVSFLSAVALLSTYSMTAQADSTYNLGIAFIGMICTTQGNSQSCTSTPNPVEQNISITVGNCSTDTNSGALNCSGSWQTTMNVNGTTYAGLVNVGSTTPTGGSTTYTVTYATGTSSTNISIGEVIPASGAALTDISVLISPFTAAATAGQKNGALFAVAPPQTHGFSAKLNIPNVLKMMR